MRVNGVLWQPREEGPLPNSGRTRFLPDGADFTGAEIVSRSGRDLVALETRADGLSVHFSDNPNGADDYEIVVRFRTRLRASTHPSDP